MSANHPNELVNVSSPSRSDGEVARRPFGVVLQEPLHRFAVPLPIRQAANGEETSRFSS